MKKTLAIGIISLFLFSGLTPISIGLNVKTTNDEETQSNITDSNHQWPMYKHDSRHTGLSDFDASDNPGVEKWKYFSDDPLLYTTAIDKNGILYTGSDWDEIYALYSNGTLKWKQNLPNTHPKELAISPDGTIFVGTNNNFYAYYPNGTLKWTLDIDEEKLFTGYPTIDNNGTVYVGTADGYLYAVYPNSTIKWVNNDSSDVRAPALDVQGNVYFTSRDGHLYCLNLDGSLKWKSRKLSNSFDYGPVIGDDGTIYALPRDNWLSAFNPDGSEKWYKELPDASGQVSIAPDGTLIVCGRYEGVSAIDPNDGNILWTYTVHLQVEKTITNAAISSDGTIFFAYPNCLCALNPDGSLKWKEHLSTDIYPYDDLDIFGGPSISSDGTVYVTTWYMSPIQGFYDFGYIHAIGKGNPDAPTTPKISGRKSGLPVLMHSISVVSSSPSGSDLFYLVDWGDGSEVYWDGPYHSGEKVIFKHNWIELHSTTDYYNIAVRAKDVNGLFSPWGEFEMKISFSRNSESYSSLFLSFLDHFPIIKEVLSQLK